MPTLETSVQGITLGDITTRDKTFLFREPDSKRINEIKNEIKEWGQFYPVSLEEIAPGRFRIIDGFTRIQALKRLTKETKEDQPVQANIYRTSEMNHGKIFNLLYQKNFLGKHPYTIKEKCTVITHFNQLLTVAELSLVSKLPTHTIEDYLDLSVAENSFFELLTDRNLDPRWAIMLYRRYLGWLKTKYHYLALDVVHKLMTVAAQETLTMKKWRFYLDFYWEGERPSLAAFK